MSRLTPGCNFLWPAAGNLPAHLQATREKVAVELAKNAQRIAAVRRPKGEAKTFAVGDAVLLLPSKLGRVGRRIGPKKILCRVCAIMAQSGHVTMYKLRCNAGVLPGHYQVKAMQAAPPAAAARLQFEGVEHKGVPQTTLKQAQHAEPGGAAVVSCGCTGKKCGARCACKKQGAKCSRDCLCTYGKGGNCGN